VQIRASGEFFFFNCLLENAIRNKGKYFKHELQIRTSGFIFA
jgi:hypothetical protein